jgi:putative transposase
MGKQPHLVGGGLIRSLGGWSEVKALRRIGIREKADARILGCGSFVSRILDEADLIRKHMLANLDREKMALQLVESACEKGGISVQALSGGSRLRDVLNVRRDLRKK